MFLLRKADVKGKVKEFTGILYVDLIKSVEGLLKLHLHSKLFTSIRTDIVSLTKMVINSDIDTSNIPRSFHYIRLITEKEQVIYFKGLSVFQ